MAKKLLLLDCDGVIFDSTKLIDKRVREIEYRASDAYCDRLNKLSARYHNELHRLEIERSADAEQEEQLNQSIENVRLRRKEHFYLKDMVLEEVLPKYKDKIDYYAIYQLENAFAGVIEKIDEMSEMGIFDDIYVVSHYNSQNEAQAKMNFFSYYLPRVKVMLIKFHKQEFSWLPEDEEKNKKRERTNKIQEFMDLMQITDLSMTYFIDDSLSIVEEAEKLGVSHSLYKDKKVHTNSLLEKVVEHAIYDSNRKNSDDNHGKRR